MNKLFLFHFLPDYLRGKVLALHVGKRVDILLPKSHLRMTPIELYLRPVWDFIMYYYTVKVVYKGKTNSLKINVHVSLSQ